MARHHHAADIDGDFTRSGSVVTLNQAVNKWALAIDIKSTIAVLLILSLFCCGGCSEEQVKYQNPDNSDAVNTSDSARQVEADEVEQLELSEIDHLVEAMLLAHAQGRLIEHRPSWPRDTPVHIRVRHHVFAILKDLELSAPISFAYIDCHGNNIGWIPTHGTMLIPGTQYEYIDGPRGETFAVPFKCIDDTDELNLWLLLKLGEESTMLPITVPIAIAESVDDLIVSDPDQVMTELLLDTMNQAWLHVDSPESDVLTLYLQFPKHVPSDHTLALRVRLEVNGKTIATGPVLCSHRCRSNARGDVVWVRLTMKASEPPKCWNGDGGSVMLSITSDAELGLRDFAATHVWEGSIVVPLVHDELSPIRWAAPAAMHR